MALNVKRIVPMEHILKGQEDDPNPASVTLKPIDARCDSYLRDRMFSASSDSNGETTTEINLGTSQLLNCKIAIIGWKNINDENGNEIQFKTEKLSIDAFTYDVASEESLNIIKPYLDDISNTIVKMNQLGEKGAKN